MIKHKITIIIVAIILLIMGGCYSKVCNCNCKDCGEKCRTHCSDNACFPGEPCCEKCQCYKLPGIKIKD